MKWKRILAWTLGSLLAIIFIVVVGGYAVLRTGRFHRYVVAKIEQTAGEATGGRVELQSFDFHLSTLTLNLYGFVIRGTEGPKEAPLLAVDKVTANLKILSIFGRDVNLRELLVAHPVVHLVIDKTGRTNIPSPNAPQHKSSETNVFDLAVGHVLLSNGAIFYNDQKNLLQANVYDLRTEVNFSSLLTKYTGTIVYNRGELKYGDFAPVAHNLDFEFSAVPSQFSVSKLALSVGSSRIAFNGNLTDYNNPKVDGRYDILIHTQDFNGFITNASAGGDIALGGSVQYQNRDGQPLLKNVVLDGQVGSGELNLSSPDGRVAIRSLRGKYQLANGNLVAPDLALNLLNGSVRANLNMQHLDQNPASKLQASLQGLSIDAAKQAAKGPSLRTLPMSGTVSGKVEASWNGSMQGLLAKSDVYIKGALHNHTSSASAVPMNGAVHLAYDGSRNLITLRDTTVQTPSTSVAAQGTIGDKSNLTVQARAADLRELSSLVSALQASTDTLAPKPLDIRGSAVANATVTGTLKNPSIAAHLTAENLQVEGSQWKSLRLAADANASQVVIKDGTLTSAAQGQITFNGNVGLRDWSYLPANPIALNISAHQIAIADLQHIARLNYPVSGILSVDATLRGSQLEPVGHGTLQLTQAKAYDQPIQTFAAQFEAANGKVTSTLQVKLTAGSATAKVDYTPKTTAYQFQLEAPKIVLQELQAVRAKNLPMQGVLSATANGTGTTNDPQLTANIQIPELQLQQTKATGIAAHLSVANHRADVTLNSNVSEATIRGKASVELTGDYSAVASLDTTSLPLTSLLATYVTSLPNDLDSRIEMHASLKGPLKDKTRLEGHVTIPALSAKYQQLQVANAGPIRLDYANSILTIQPSQLTGTETSLRFQGRVPIQSDAPMELTAQGSLNLRLLHLLSPDLQSSGTLALDVRGTGNAAHPGVEGQIKIQKAAFLTSDSPVGLENLNGILTLANGCIQLSDVKGQAGGGNITIGGSIGYQPQLQFDIAINAQSVRLLYPDGIRSVFDGNIGMTGTLQEATLNGRVLINSLSFTPDFDLAAFMSQAGAASVSTSSDSFTNNLKLNIQVQSTENLQAVSSEVSVEGSANLRVIGTAADPVIIGRADLNSGDIFFMKNRYHLERGIVNFINPTRTDPSVNILITTVIEQYNLSLALVGPVDRLRTTYTSDPPLPPVDIINLVARGQTTEESATGNFDANQVLAAGLASQVSSRIGKLAGISSLTIDPLLGGTNGNPSARVAVQQRVTRNFVFTFSTDVTQPEAEIIQGEYQISKRWSVSATRDQYGGFAFDGRFHTTF